MSVDPVGDVPIMEAVLVSAISGRASKMEVYQYLQCPPRYSHCSGVRLQLSSLDE